MLSKNREEYLIMVHGEEFGYVRFIAGTFAIMTSDSSSYDGVKSLPRALDTIAEKQRTGAWLDEAAVGKSAI